MSQWFQYYFQESNSSNCVDLMWLNDWGLMVASFVLGFVVYMMFMIMINDTSFLKFSDHQLLETLWTTLPVFLLISMAIPSISILYLHDSAKTWTQLKQPYANSAETVKESQKMPSNDGLIVKVIGNQWYWTYEYTPWIPLLKNLSFDSYLAQYHDSEVLNSSLLNYRLLSVDNELVLPSWTQIKFIMSSNDVIHSFAVPSLALKVDTIPGTSSQFNININTTGQLTGFCMELCGTGHANMPIVIHATHPLYFCTWLMKSIILSNPNLFNKHFMDEDTFMRISTALTTFYKEMLSSMRYPETNLFFKELDSTLLKFKQTFNSTQTLCQAIAMQYAWEAHIKYQESIFNKTAAILLWQGKIVDKKTYITMQNGYLDIWVKRSVTDPHILPPHPKTPFEMGLDTVPTLISFSKDELK